MGFHRHAHFLQSRNRDAPGQTSELFLISEGGFSKTCILNGWKTSSCHLVNECALSPTLVWAIHF